MLVSMKQNVLERATDRPRRRPRRTLGIVGGLVAVIIVGSASGALALGVLPTPFAAKEPAAPTSTPTPVVTSTATPSPSATPTTTPPAEVDTAPTSTVPISCDALGTAIGVSTLIPGTVSASSGIYSADDAARLQAGVLSCLWGGTDPQGPLLSMDVSTDTTGARAWLASRLAAGNTSMGVDSASAVGCQTLSTGCDLSMIGSRYWVEATYEGTQDTTATISATLSPMAQRLISTLSGLTPAPAWDEPSSSWSTITSCSALATTKPMSDAVASPGMVGPDAVNAGSRNGIERASDALDCLWAVPDGSPTASGAPSRIDVDVVSGGAWAYRLYVDDSDTLGTSTPVTVQGADEARLDCALAENQTCSLDVLADRSWIQVGLGDSLVATDQATLVAAAEAVLGAHR